MPAVVILMLVVGGIIIAFSLQAAAARRKLLGDWARRQGWLYQQAKDRRLRTRYDFDCLDRGHSRFARNICTGDWHGLQAAAFDYQYTTGSGKNSHTYNFSAVILTSPISLKPLHISPEGFFDKVSAFFGYDDIDFESAEFSDLFCVKAESRRWAYDVLHQRTMALLLAHPTFSISFNYDHVIVWRDKRLQPADFEEAMDLVKAILDGLPDYVVQQQTQES